MKNCLLLAAVAAVFVLSASAYAADITIPNASFEDRTGITAEGQDVYLKPNEEVWAKWEEWNRNGSTVKTWNPGDPAIMQAAQATWDPVTQTGTDGVYRRRNEGFGGLAADGEQCINVRTYWDDSKADPYTGVSDFEGAMQILTDTFDPFSTYILTAAVGNPGGLYYNWDEHRAGNKNVVDIEKPYYGYDLQIAAGGTYEGTDPNTAPYEPHITGGTVIAQNPNTTALPDDVWHTGTTTYTPNPAGQQFAGEPIQVRLLALEDPNDHSIIQTAAFDDVKLKRFLAGDANMDDDVDVWAFDGSGDAQILSENLGTPLGALWSEGDFNGDGDVDVWQLDGFGDAQLLSQNLGETLDAPAGTAAAIYNAVTGELSFDVGEGIAVIGIEAEGLKHGDVDSGSPLGTPGQNGGNVLAYFNAAGLQTGMSSVGVVLPTGLTEGDLAFGYTPVGGASTVVPVTVIVPEPSTIAMLLVLGAVTLCWRRRSA